MKLWLPALGMVHTAERQSEWTTLDTVFSVVYSIAIILVWISLGYGIVYGDMVAIVGPGFILVLDALHDIRNR